MGRMIDGDALIDAAIERYCKNCDRRKGIKNGKWTIVYEIGDGPCRVCIVDVMKCDIEAAPIIYPERNKGRWIDLRCSECGQVDMSKPNFCPNCGADMREEK